MARVNSGLLHFIGVRKEVREDYWALEDEAFLHYIFILFYLDIFTYYETVKRYHEQKKK